MAKPILITRVPYKFWKETALEGFDQCVEKSCPDYNFLIVFDDSNDQFQFEVLNVQDYPQIDFDTLKTKLESEYKIPAASN